MHLKTEKYIQGRNNWGKGPKTLTAQFDDQGVWIFQCFNSQIARYVTTNQKFIGAPNYKLTRMSWLKLDFLWLQNRSGWGMQPDEEKCLAIKLTNEFFLKLLEKAIDNNNPNKDLINNADVLFQWDNSYLPNGEKDSRKCLQIGIRNQILNDYAEGKNDIILKIVDISDFITGQRKFTNDPKQWNSLDVPVQRPLNISNQELIDKIMGISTNINPIPATNNTITA